MASIRGHLLGVGTEKAGATKVLSVPCSVSTELARSRTLRPNLAETDMVTQRTTRTFSPEPRK